VKPETTGEECAPGDVYFRQPEFDELTFILEVWVLDAQLICVATTSQSYEQLYVDASERYFGAWMARRSTASAHRLQKLCNASFWVSVRAHCCGLTKQD
jgi:hypothetical protein